MGRIFFQAMYLSLSLESCRERGPLSNDPLSGREGSSPGCGVFAKLEGVSVNPNGCFSNFLGNRPTLAFLSLPLSRCTDKIECRDTCVCLILSLGFGLSINFCTY